MAERRPLRLADLALQPGSIVLPRPPSAEERATRVLTADLATVGADLLMGPAPEPALQATAPEEKPDILTLLRRCKAQARAAAERHAQELAAMSSFDNTDTPATATATPEECPLDLALVGLPQIKPLQIDQGGELELEDQVGGAPVRAVAPTMAVAKPVMDRVALDEMARQAGVRMEREYVLRLLRTHERLAPQPDWSMEESAWRSVLANDQWARVEMALIRMLPPAGRKGPSRGWHRVKR